MAKLSEKRRKKLEERKKKLNEKGGGIPYFIFKEEGTYRMRPLPVPDDKEPGVEVTFFFVPQVGGVVSPATFGEPCAISEKYEELSASDDEGDLELAKNIKPRRKYMMPVLKYNDDKGNEPDEESGPKLVLLTNQQYNDVIDCMTDEEWGDPTDPNEGYDIKFKREGKGQYDTEYSTTPCMPSKIPKKYRKKSFDPEEMVRNIMPDYEKTEELLSKFLNTGEEEEEEEDKPKKKGVKKKKGTKKETKKKGTKKGKADV